MLRPLADDWKRVIQERLGKPCVPFMMRGYGTPGRFQVVASDRELSKYLFIIAVRYKNPLGQIRDDERAIVRHSRRRQMPGHASRTLQTRLRKPIRDHLHWQ
jgi:hypothetical protein